MATIITNSENYTNIANAIRTKTNSSENYTPREMATAILSISTGVPEEEILEYINNHNENLTAHNDIRILINNLTTRLNALADSDDVTLDQLSEIVAHIKSNKSLIDSITTENSGINNSINNLTTRLNALADSDDVTLDQLSEIVAYIKSNKSLIDSITTAKVSVSGDTMTGDLIAAPNTTGVAVVRNIAYGTYLPETVTEGTIFILIEEV